VRHKATSFSPYASLTSVFGLRQDVWDAYAELATLRRTTGDMPKEVADLLNGHHQKLINAVRPRVFAELSSPSA
jgi:hypothetical protein